MGGRAYEWPGRDDVGTDESAALSLTASRSSLVLLRNDKDLLPLPKGKRIAVIGPHADATKVMTQPYPFSPQCPVSRHLLANLIECTSLGSVRFDHR